MTLVGLNLNSMMRILTIISLLIFSMSFAHSKESSAQDVPADAMGKAWIAHRVNLNTEVDPAISESSNSKEACIARGQSNRQGDLIVAAINDWKNAVVIDPNCGQAWLTLGEAYQFLGQLRDTITCYNNALALQPLDVSRETIEEKVTKLQEEILQEEADPLWANCNVFIKCVRLVTGPPDPGIDGKMAVRRTQSPSEALNNVVADAAREAEKSGDYEKAVKLYEELIASDPGNAANFVNMAVALELLGRHEEAIRQYEEAVRLSPKNADPMIAIGDIYSISMGDDKTALYWYAKAIQETADPSKKKAIAHRISKFMLGAKSR